MRAPPRIGLRLLGVALGLASACCSPDASSPALGLELEGAMGLGDPAAEAEASDRVNRFAAAPDWSGLVELLGQDHASARALLGPHQLRYTAALDTGPAALAPSQPLPPARVGEPIMERFAVEDQLELRWAAQPGEAPRLQLEQHNEHQHGRALIVIGEQAWSELDGRGWLARPLETNLWQLWADDAQHAVLDLVELAGPHVDLDEIGPVTVDGRDALRVTLRASEQRHPDRVVEALAPWRRDAQLELGEATIVLDRRTGLWLAAQLTLSWTFEDSAGRELRGSARFDGRVEVMDPPPIVEPPPDPRPLPERDRPELLRQRLLDGLAAG